MSDKKKPGAPNIKDLKAKLGLKTPGGEAPPPPVMTPPPGVPGGDAFPAPPGVEPPAAVKPPPGVTPPPGIAPPAVTPPPGIAPPPTDLVAPPGFQAPVPAAPAPGEPVFASTPQQVDIDLDSVQSKKSRKIVWVLVAAFASLLSMCGGYYFGDARLKKGWMAKSKKSCATTADVVKKLYNNTKEFEATLEAEVDKTKKGAQPMAYYNPELFTKLSEVADKFDVNNANLKTILNKQIWTTHFRFVKDAGEVLPRLHTFLSLLAQLKSAVDIGRGVEAKYGAALKKKTRKYKEETAKQPTFGVMIRGDKAGLFFALGNPVDKDGKKAKDHGSAEGYLLPNGKPGMFGKPPAKPNECPEVSGTIRIFGADDAELNNRLKCRGQEDIVFEAWTIAIMQIRLLLKQLEAVNPKDLYQRFQKSS